MRKSVRWVAALATAVVTVTAGGALAPAAALGAPNGDDTVAARVLGFTTSGATAARLNAPDGAAVGGRKGRDGAAVDGRKGRDGTARVTGTAEFRLTFSPDDDVRKFAFDVESTPYTHPLPGLPGGLPSDARGTVRVSHFVAAQRVTVTMDAAVDCLTTSPGYAALTAVVTRADEPVKDWVGTRLGFSVQDAGRGGHGDRVGFNWSLSADQNENGDWVQARVGTCLAPAPFAPVTRGDLTVRHVDLLPQPQG